MYLPLAGLGAVECDPFWSEQNGACSDTFGQYVNRNGVVLDPITGRAAGSASAGLGSYTPLIIGAVVLFLLSRGGR